MMFGRSKSYRKTVESLRRYRNEPTESNETELVRRLSSLSLRLVLRPKNDHAKQALGRALIAFRDKHRMSDDIKARTSENLRSILEEYDNDS